MDTLSLLAQAPFACASRNDNGDDDNGFYDEGGDATNRDHRHFQEGAPGGKYVPVDQIRSRRIARRH